MTKKFLIIIGILSLAVYAIVGFLTYCISTMISTLWTILTHPTLWLLPSGLGFLWRIVASAIIVYFIYRIYGKASIEAKAASLQKRGEDFAHEHGLTGSKPKSDFPVNPTTPNVF